LVKPLFAERRLMKPREAALRLVPPLLEVRLAAAQWWATPLFAAPRLVEPPAAKRRLMQPLVTAWR
jgi:hypothetical protein